MADGSVNRLPIGTVVHERYRISAVVGQGGLGTVYQVADVFFGRGNVYALKELIDQSPGARKQFELESQWLQSLDHNHIPKVREHFEWQNRLYLVMDFVDGENLERKLARLGGRPLPEQEALGWILPICEALSYLHTRQPPILHRDVKPANIIVTSAGHAVLVDLGIAKEHLPGAGQTATFVRKAGTEGYAPPEQYTTAGLSGPWSDVYALGATLYQLLTGCLPPTAVDRVAMDTPLMRVREINPMVSPPVDAAVYRSLAIRPADRFASMAEFARALRGMGQSSAQQPWQAPPMAAGPSGGLGTAPYTPVLGSMSPRVPAPSPRPSSQPSVWAASQPRQASHPSDSVSELSGRISAYTGSLRTISPPKSDGDAVRAEGGARERQGRRGRARHGRLRSWPLLLGSGLAAVLLVAVVAFAVLGRLTPPDRSSPSATIMGYFDALSARDYGRAWQYASASRTDPGSQSTFVSGLQADDARYGTVQDAHITHVDTSGAGQAAAGVDVTRANAPGGVITYSVLVTQFDGNTWLISSLATS
jgi:serine/threonine-protein kinase